MERADLIARANAIANAMTEAGMDDAFVNEGTGDEYPEIYATVGGESVAVIVTDKI